MLTNNYSDPVARLLAIGDPRSDPSEPDWRGLYRWRDYLAQYGLKQEHIPELTRMATDEALNHADSESGEVWAPLHAWRALGQLGAVQAVRPLLTLLHRIDDDNDDWVGEDLPEALALIGPAAIPALAEYLDNPENKLWARVAASSTLEKIGNAYPQARGESIAALTRTLEHYASNDEILNGDIIAALADLDAVEAAPLVEQAYKADMVDESIMGDWEDFQVEVGLLEERVTALEEEELNFNPFLPDEYGGAKTTRKKEEKKVKQKRKQAKASRKKNRKKK